MSRQTLANHPAVSFTVKRPSPLSREVHGPGTDVSFPAPVPIAWPPSNPVSGNSSPLPLSGSNYGDNNSSDEDAGTEDEIITGFDSLGVQRCVNFVTTCSEEPHLNSHSDVHDTISHSVREIPNKGPLVIPSLANRDWRAAARRRQSSKIFVPDSGKAAVGVGADGSVGGLGTRDTINSGPQLSGIITAKRRKFDSDQMAGEGSVPAESTGDVAIIDSESRGPPDEELTEDQRALRAILSGEEEEVPRIDIIPEVPTPKSETEAYREDVVNRPDSATLEDYARVPVEQFGAALLRGMGWKEGMAASKTRKGPVEPYVPVSRPALLGIGAKERPVEDTTPANGNFGPQRPEKRYVPVVKRARDGTIITNDPQPVSLSHPFIIVCPILNLCFAIATPVFRIFLS